MWGKKGKGRREVVWSEKKKNVKMNNKNKKMVMKKKNDMKKYLKEK
jgi:hypothetical protein